MNSELENSEDKKEIISLQIDSFKLFEDNPDAKKITLITALLVIVLSSPFIFIWITFFSLLLNIIGANCSHLLTLILFFIFSLFVYQLIILLPIWLISRFGNIKQKQLWMAVQIPAVVIYLVWSFGILPKLC